MPFKLIVQNSKIVLKTVANYILNVSGIKDLYTASSDVDSNGKIDWSLQHYSGTAASFTSNNPILLVGQLGIETDDLSTTPKFKIGDGVTAWNSLPYAISGGGGSQSLQDVVTVSPTVDGVLAESLDTTQKYEITNDGLKLNGAPSTTAKTITLNKDGVLNSSTGSGIEFEEDGGIVGYIKTAVGAAFDFLHALNPFRARIALNLLTGNRTYNLPDNSGTIALTSDIPSLAGYEQTANKSSSYTASSTTTYANTKALVDGLSYVFSNVYKKIILDTTTSGTTSGTSITLLKSGLIPANTVQVGSKLRMVAKFYKTGSLGQGRTRFYINTSNTLTGATLLATQGLSTGNFFSLTRTPEVKSATNTEFPLTSTSLSGDEGGVVAMASMSSININWTVDQYIIAAGECANAGDSMTCQSLEVLYL